MKFAYLFLHSDEWKSYSSMNPAENDTIFRDTKKDVIFSGIPLNLPLMIIP